MRRIYESGALDRDDEDPYRPSERDARPRAARTLPAGTLSRLLIPESLRYRAISVSVSTPRSEYAPGEPIPFEVAFRNPLPVPLSVPTPSPVRWTWNVDGLREASHVEPSPPDDRSYLEFDRGECKRFRRRWRQSFRVSESEWETAAPGEYTIGAGLNVDDAASRGLYDDLTVRISPE